VTVLLRPVQSTWISDISAAFSRHKRVVGVANTGFGKTVCFCEVTRRTVERGGSVVIMAHRTEIVQQIGLALSRAGVPFGWVMAGGAVSRSRVQVGMVQSIAGRLKHISPPKLLVIDEAHHATAGSYKKIVEAWPDAFVLGATASPQRTDGAGLASCFDTMVLGPPMRELIDRGYLADFRYFAPEQKADLTGVKVRAGDYSREELSNAMDRASITGDAVKWYAERLAGKPAIAFCVSVEHSRHVAEQFSASGWKAASVDGSTDRHVRADLIAAIGDGRLNVLTSCDIISEGTDIPAVAGALLLRPTQSLIVFLQQCGRVLRPKSDGSKAIILDHVSSVFKFGMPDEEREWTLEGRAKRSTAAPVVICPACYAAHRPGPRCPSCDYIYEATRASRSSARVREGDLVEVGAAVRPKPSADRVKEMVRLAFRQETDLGVRLALQQIQREQGYKPSWVFMQMQLRAKYRGRKRAA
jgi:DNA repair protein RadD